MVAKLVSNKCRSIHAPRRLPLSGVFRQGKQKEETPQDHSRNPALKQGDRLESSKPVQPGESRDTAD